MESHSKRRSRERSVSHADGISHPAALPIFLVIVMLGTLTPAAPWVLHHGLLFLSAGAWLILFLPRVAIPKLWWISAGVFLLMGLAPMLPATWFEIPAWRKSLESLGVETGPHVAIQWRQALEQYGVFAVMLVTGLGVAGHRASPSQVKNLALAFSLSVAGYALLAQILKEMLPVNTYSGHFGFFVNRNHTGTFLAMGVICGLGVILHSVRNKEFWRLGVSIVATAILVWAAFSWSISRAGVLLCGIGFVIWFALLGRRYWGRNELKAIGLIALLGVGAFLLAETKVKNRITQTADRFSEATSKERLESSNRGLVTDSLEQINEVDFRVPIALDAFDMIGDAPITGIGAGQFRYVFPQYRTRSSIVNDAECVHPENDWLWMAAELGVPATLALAALVMSAFAYALINIGKGRDRALRLGCLVAAAIVPIHGGFDVPGHRVALAWASAFLFVISLNPPTVNHAEKKIRVIIWRTLAVVILAGGIRLLGTQWSWFETPHLIRARQDLDRAQTSYAILVKPKQKLPLGEIYSRRTELASQMRTSQILSPLEGKLYLLEGLALMPIGPEWPQIDRAFSIQRTLSPMWVKVPFIQAGSWISRDQKRTGILWRETLLTADRVDKFVTKSGSFRSRNEASIRRLAKANSALVTIAEAAIADKMLNE